VLRQVEASGLFDRRYALVVAALGSHTSGTYPVAAKFFALSGGGVAH
jgi:hypothetical protein